MTELVPSTTSQRRGKPRTSGQPAELTKLIQEEDYINVAKVSRQRADVKLLVGREKTVPT